MIFIRQLTELLTNYGEVHEVWFDGANGEGPNGKKQVYDWDAFYQTIQRLQPKAVMAIMGDDVRWVGNEKGVGRETEWNATVLTPGIYARSQENNKRLVFSVKQRIWEVVRYWRKLRNYSGILRKSTYLSVRDGSIMRRKMVK